MITLISFYHLLDICIFQFYNFIQAMALVVSIIFGFALFTYAFNAYAEVSRRQMNILRAKYEGMATKNAILAFAQVFEHF